MKRIRLDRWSGQLLSPRTRPCCLRQQQHQRLSQIVSGARSQPLSTDVEFRRVDVDEEGEVLAEMDLDGPVHASPLPQAALRSAKLGALHARLSLSKKIPLQTMARTLVDPTADTNVDFNNAALAQIGGNLMSYYVSEWIMCRYPRLPMTVLFAAAYAYNGPKTLQIVAREWGVETVAAPGAEVDPGLLQFSKVAPGTTLNGLGAGQLRADKAHYRRGISSRNVYDDEFGDIIPSSTEKANNTQTTENAYANFVKAVVGAIYVHAGREAAKTFITQHILSRHLDVSKLFEFKYPVRDLARLCARENFEFPVARMLSETGRMSISPVFVVGIFSGADNLGEGAGPSLEEARLRASVAALKSWYLYSPGNDIRLPSEMESENPAPWKPVYIDIGEIV
ncbi:54S ribosomal protein L3 [Phlyctema vagabunda]|uniref:Large ribosomal subunit protein mL44 n=1 Tax=Phlyctema vagabunda TaxID=108571 RepID=A0ABR4P4T9_9HELO